jgi:hypothetical protein
MHHFHALNCVIVQEPVTVQSDYKWDNLLQLSDSPDLSQSLSLMCVHILKHVCLNVNAPIQTKNLSLCSVL